MATTTQNAMPYVEEHLPQLNVSCLLLVSFLVSWFSVCSRCIFHCIDFFYLWFVHPMLSIFQLHYASDFDCTHTDVAHFCLGLLPCFTSDYHSCWIVSLLQLNFSTAENLTPYLKIHGLVRNWLSVYFHPNSKHLNAFWMC